MTTPSATPGQAAGTLATFEISAWTATMTAGSDGLLADPAFGHGANHVIVIGRLERSGIIRSVIGSIRS
jgi:hypothetical protein